MVLTMGYFFSMSNYHVTVKSNNRKTGSLVVVTSSKDTCPAVCPFKTNGCYAMGGPLRLHWDRVSSGERGFSFSHLVQVLKSLPERTKVRLWQAGDMPGKGNNILLGSVKKLVASLKSKLAYGYTHKPVNYKQNRQAIKYCNDNGVTINLSANNMAHADELYKEGIGPVVVTLQRNFKGNVTPDGHKIKICPAARNKNVSCNSCGGDVPLCARANRDYIIAFPAHGNGVKKVEAICEA
jgi:hypothetical protein